MELSPDNKALSLLTRIERFLASYNIRAYVVGGFLRDTLLCRKTDDIDIAIEADALAIASELASFLGGRFVPLDKTNGVGRIIMPHPECAETQWQLDFSGIDGSILKDLGRRDFTIDAIAINLDDITRNSEIYPVIDPFNGVEDLQRKTVRAVDDSIFKNDAARLLRAVRLSAELGFNITSKTEALIKRDCSLISGVAGERIREELLKIIALYDSGRYILYMEELGLIEAFMPELQMTKGIEQPKEHQWDVFNHSVKTMDAVDFVLRKSGWRYAADSVLDCVPWPAEMDEYFAEKISGGSDRRLLLKMAALFHDIAKPQTKIINEKGRIRFYHHPQEGAPITTDIMERLRFSSRENRLVTAIVHHHLRPVQINRDGEPPTRRAIYRYYRDTGEAAVDTLFFSLADHLAARGKDLDMENWRWHAGMVKYILEQSCAREEATGKNILINGYDIINNFDLKPGPELGRLLEAVREAHACGEIATKEEALDYARRLLTPEEED